MKHKIIAEMVDITSNIGSVQKLLSDSLKTGQTKDRMKMNIKAALHELERNKKRLCAYHNNLIPIVPGAPENTLEEELQKIHEDIGTALFYIAQNKHRDAEKLLLSIKKRISGT